MAVRTTAAEGRLWDFRKISEILLKNKLILLLPFQNKPAVKQTHKLCHCSIESDFSLLVQNIYLLTVDIQVQVICIDFVVIIEQSLIRVVICGHRKTCGDGKGFPIHTCLHRCGPVFLGRRVKFLHPTEAMDINPRMFGRG